jgi:phage antirepressor YoqD-like protein
MNRRTVEVFNQVFTTGSVSMVTSEVQAIASNLIIIVTSYAKFYGNGERNIIRFLLTHYLPSLLLL